MDKVSSMKHIASDIVESTASITEQVPRIAKENASIDQRLNTTRRHFLKVSTIAAGVLAVGVSVPMAHRRAMADTSNTEPSVIDLWITIDENDQVTIAIANSEMGQGVYTSMAMLVA